MITGIAHVCLGATDLATTERFYCTALGFKKVFEFVRGGEPVGFYLEVTDKTYVEVFQQDAVEAQANGPIRHICFETANIDAVRRSLEAEGCEATEKRLGADGSWQTWTTDPDGVRIEFHQYTPESSQVTGNDCILD